MGYGSSIAMSCGVGHKRSSDPALLWLWCRPAAVDLIGPLARKPPLAADVALKKKRKQKKKKYTFKTLLTFLSLSIKLDSIIKLCECYL